MNVGLNLFSIRNLIKTEEDFLNTALKLREMGYTTMQYSGGDFLPDRIKRVSDASGLPIWLHTAEKNVASEITEIPVMPLSLQKKYF